MNRHTLKRTPTTQTLRDGSSVALHVAANRLVEVEIRVADMVLGDFLLEGRGVDW